MPATNISLVIKDHADDTLKELLDERVELVQRLREVQHQIGLIEQHKMIESVSNVVTRSE